MLTFWIGNHVEREEKMYIQQVEIKNFRLLSDVDLALEAQTTVIVGRNNSGKTSLSEVIRRLLADGSVTFQLEDFSSVCYDDFCKALTAFNEGQDETDLRKLIPAIELRLSIQYDPTKPQLGPLSPFIIDLNPACTEARVVIRYELKNGQVAQLLEGLPKEALTTDTRVAFFRTLRERIPAAFAIQIWAEDPDDAQNHRLLQPGAIRSLIKTGFINAQRGLDDITSRESDVLAKIVESLFATASSHSADAADKQIANALEGAVHDIQDQIDANFGGQLKSLIPALKTFGYPGLGSQELHTETLLDVRKLLSNFTKVRYTGFSGITLPESYNGLGARNLIFILLQLAGFYKAYRAEKIEPGVHLIFIEEPEAHLHPQMQEVFIKKLSEIAQKLVDGTEDKQPWPVQFIVSTHSSHVANAAGFESIRYFLSAAAPDADEGMRITKIKDLRKGLKKTDNEAKKFLHQYMTLTRCDLFFADKAILVEGLSERLLLPIMMAKLEDETPKAPKLSSQYITIMEVGGAYAQLFFELLQFLELQTLIITDIDSVEKPGGEACAVHLGQHSSNTCIRAWFSEDDPYTLKGLLEKKYVDKIQKGNRIAYQCPELATGPCGRTFEDAFILANSKLFGLTSTTVNELENEARTQASKWKKSEFALKYAIAEKNWSTPLYIAEGLRWLAPENNVAPDPVLALAIEAAADLPEQGASHV